MTVSTSMPIAYHQQTLATLAPGWARRSASQTFSPATRLLGWRQNITSPRSRKNQPLPTAPCSAGIFPVRKVDCTEQVTAGSTVPRVGPAALLGERAQPWHVLQRPRRQAHDVEEQHGHGRGARGGSGAVVGGGHGVSLSPRSSSWSRTQRDLAGDAPGEVVVGAGRAASGSTPQV